MIAVGLEDGGIRCFKLNANNISDKFIKVSNFQLKHKAYCFKLTDIFNINIIIRLMN